MKVVLVRCPAFGPQNAPINLGLLSAYLKTKGYLSKCFDFNIELYSEHNRENQIKYWNMSSYMFWTDERLKQVVTDEVIEKWLDRICEEDPKVVGFSIYSTSYLVTLEVAEKLKKKAPHIKIVFGGPYIREDHGVVEESIQNDFVDAIALGEGEETFLELVQQVEKDGMFSKCPGAIINIDGEIIHGGDRPNIGNLDETVIPDFIDFDLKKYDNFVLPILSSRGCIYNCAFCNERTFWGKYRVRTAKHIFAEMFFQYHKYDVDEFFFCDLAVNGNLKVLDELCDMLIRADMNIKWGGYMLVRKMSRELILKMGKAKFQHHCIGIETGSPKMLRKMNKNFKIETAEELLRNLYDAKIKTFTSWIVGYPGETDEDFLETIDFINRNRKYIFIVNPANILNIPPGSPLAIKPDKYGVNEVKYPDLWDDGELTEETKEYRVNFFNNYFDTVEKPF